MLVGHFAVGLVAKRIEPKISLGTAILAAMLADLLVFIFMIAGIEHFAVQPGAALNRLVGDDIAYSHSLLTDTIWAALFAAAYFWRQRYPRGAWVLFLVVLSHWLLDFVSHRPDMPLAPGVHKVFGLGLWNSMPATLVVEGGFWLLAIILYVRATHSEKHAGVYAFWSVIALLTLVWHNNIAAGMNPNPVRAGIDGLVFVSLVVAWAYWIDRLAGSSVWQKARQLRTDIAHAVETHDSIISRIPTVLPELQRAVTAAMLDLLEITSASLADFSRLPMNPKEPAQAFVAAVISGWHAPPSLRVEDLPFGEVTITERGRTGDFGAPGEKTLSTLGQAREVRAEEVSGNGRGQCHTSARCGFCQSGESWS